jgi:hypothetical protein
MELIVEERGILDQQIEDKIENAKKVVKRFRNEDHISF